MQIAHIEKKAKDALDGLVKDIESLFKENLISIYLYGSAAGKGYIPGMSNLNTLILLRHIGIDDLRCIAGLYRKRRGTRLVAPLVLTSDYIEASSDVFPIEFLDIKENSVLLAGADIFKDVSIDLSHLREECEREIKGQLVNVRGSFLEVEGDGKGMERLIVTAVSNLVFPLKNILRLMRQGIPEGSDAIVGDCCRFIGVADAPFLEALEIKKGIRKVSLDGLYALISGYMTSLEEISKKIDVMKAEGRL